MASKVTFFARKSLFTAQSYSRWSALRTTSRRLHDTVVNNGETSPTQRSDAQSIVIADSAVKQLSKVATDGSFLRILVEGGGCSGFQYKFDLDDKVADDDKVFEKGGAKVVVDEVSLDLIGGSTVIFEETLISSSFQVTKNPKADAGCSCGVSFSLKL